MKTSLKTLLALAAFGASALFATAQTAPKIAVVDMAKVFEGHYKTQEQQEKLKADEAKVQEEVAKIMKDGQASAEKFKELDEQAKNPVLTADARKTAQEDAMKQLEEVRKKEQQFADYRNEMNRSFQQRIGTFQQMMFGEISKVASDVAKKKGATILIEKKATIYADPSYEITDEVLAEVNKGRPTVTAPAAPAATKTGDAPSVLFPGAKK